MPSALDTLIGRIPDERLRADIRRAVSDLRKVTDFGLVFENHIPETIRLPHHSIRRETKVTFRDLTDQSMFEVISVNKPMATIRRIRHQDGSALSLQEVEEVENQVTSLSSLVALADFGDAIYPGMRHLGSIQRGGDKPAHVVIKGENHHVLEALQFTHAGKIDCIYIDPPYNNRSKEWKYNNNYVDKQDVYKHSKWLAMMQRRLLLAKQLLNPDRSALIVTIDENEFLQLGLLLEQIFRDAEIQMVTTVISAKGAVRPGKFSRVEEHIFFVTQGQAKISRWTHKMLEDGSSDDETTDGDNDDSGNEPIAIDDKPRLIEWLGLRRREPSSRRGTRPNQFYPIFVNADTGFIHSVGDAVNDDVDRQSVQPPEGTVALWPLKPDGTEMIWGLTPDVLRHNWKQGYVRINNWNPAKRSGTVKYLPSGTIDEIRQGTITVVGRAKDGSVEGFHAPASETLVPPKRVWNMPSHNAETGGTKMLSQLIPNRRFDYPKSLYAVEDTLRFVIGDQPDAIVLDFFAGSGTTGHAVARLNHEDGGRRRSITVTNNEVSERDSQMLRSDGYRPGDPEWEALGIFDYVTRPRITAAVTGRTPEGAAISGEYRFGNKCLLGDGFQENFEFFELTYLDADQIEVARAFSGIAPLLWLRAGGRGPIIGECCDVSGRRKPFAWTEHYGVLFNTDQWRSFVSRVPDTATTIYIVTDSITAFSQIARELPGHLDLVRLYERYLTTFSLKGALT